jgi:carbonic anhydrase/acetyltransferase-like protein (isoleucine patch superfamily)
MNRVLLLCLIFFLPLSLSRNVGHTFQIQANTTIARELVLIGFNALVLDEVTPCAGSLFDGGVVLVGSLGLR